MNDKLRSLIQDAAVELEIEKAKQAELAACTEPARIGDVYVLPNDSDVTLSWLVVNLHPDSADSVLVVPVTDFPLMGVCDVTLDTLSPEAARCGFSFWAVRSELKPENRVAAGWSWLLLAERCRKVLHRLATGQEIDHTPEQDAAEDDPEYEYHCAEVSRVGELVW